LHSDRSRARAYTRTQDTYPFALAQPREQGAKDPFSCASLRACASLLATGWPSTDKWRFFVAGRLPKTPFWLIVPPALLHVAPYPAFPRWEFPPCAGEPVSYDKLVAAPTPPVIYGAPFESAPYQLDSYVYEGPNSVTFSGHPV